MEKEMILKQKTILEVVRGDKIYQLICHPDSQLGELHDVISEFRDYVVKRINDAATIQKQEAEKAAEKVEKQA